MNLRLQEREITKAQLQLEFNKLSIQTEKPPGDAGGRRGIARGNKTRV